MTKNHHYCLAVDWTGNLGRGTTTYRGYSRDHVVTDPAAGIINGSDDPAFRGDPARWNPEQLLLASLSQCHLLWYLHLATTAGIVVTDYHDDPTGTMVENADGSGQFTEVTLRPRVTISADGDVDLALSLHGKVGEYCYIARSVTFPVHHDPVVVAAAD